MKQKPFGKIIIWFILSIGFIMISCRMGDPYTYNSNLKLLVGDTVNHSYQSTCPVVSPDGEKVYFLSLPDPEWMSEFDFQDGVGRIHEVNSDGTGKRKLLDDIFSALTISPDGKKLAALLWPQAENDSSFIALIDINTLSVESLRIYDHPVKHIEFSGDSILYFSVPSGDIWDIIVKLNLADTSEQVIGRGLGFDVSKNGELYIDFTLNYVQINPDSEDLAISHDSAGDYFLLRHIQSSKVDTLPSSLIPYVMSFVSFPYWFPSGDKVVFTCHFGRFEFPSPSQIWILENFFEQIK